MSRIIRCLFIITLTSVFLSLVLYNVYVISPWKYFKENPQNGTSDRAVEFTRLSASSDTEAHFMKRVSNKTEINLKHFVDNIDNIRKDIEEIKMALKHYDKKKTTSDDVLETNQTNKSTSLLTIFTTWKKTAENSTIQNNTLKNWSSFKPVFNPVLFTNDTTLAGDAEKYGWSTLPITKTADNDLPILKYMFIDAIRKFDSTFYCYANSDILFDDGLLKTLVHLTYKLDKDIITSTPMFLTGLRWNVIKVLEHEITPRANLKSLIKSRGKVFFTSAEDYFITNAVYPWNDIPDVVVGAVAYDNWLVLNARDKKHFTINTSRTIPAVHQSVDENEFRSHVRETVNYNAELLKNIYNINIPYHKGFIECIEKFTDFVNDTFIIGDRMVNQYCN